MRHDGSFPRRHAKEFGLFDSQRLLAKLVLHHHVPLLALPFDLVARQMDFGIEDALAILVDWIAEERRLT